MSRGFSMTSYLNQSRMQMLDDLHPERIEQRAQAAAIYDRSTDASRLPLLQQAALMQMHESHVSRNVYQRLIAEAEAKPTLSDYRALVQINMARYRPGKRVHELTPSGVVAAKKLEAQLCIRMGIHLLIEGVQVGWQQRYSCTCGKLYYVRRSTTAPGNARKQWAAEHASDAGMTTLVAALKPPVKAGVG